MTETLASLRRTLAEMDRLASSEDERRTASDFMYGIYDLGRAIHSGRLSRDQGDLVSFLAESAGKLRLFHPRIGQFISLAEGKLESGFEEGLEQDVYEWASEARSAVEFLRELYRPTAYGPYLDLLHMDDFDEELKEKAVQVGRRDAPPSGIPPAHWWWFLS